jgi:hypothetical protein
MICKIFLRNGENFVQKRYYYTEIGASLPTSDDRHRGEDRYGTGISLSIL